MADGGHTYNHCKGKVIVAGTVEGFIESDFKLEQDLGKLLVQGSEYAQDHVHGLRKVSGKLTKAWGLESGYLYDWMNDKEQKTIVFSPDGTSDKTYTCSGCTIKGMGSDIKAGGSDALILDADFEGLSWSSNDDFTP